MNSQIFLITVLGLILIHAIKKLYLHFTLWKRQGLPGFNFISYYFALERVDRYQEKYSKLFGKIFGGYRTTTPILWISDARMARDLSVKELHKFPLRNSFYKGSTNIKHALFFMDAKDDWKRVRSIVSPAFTSGKLRQMLSPIERISGNFIENLRPFAKSGQEFDIKKYIGGFAMDVIACCGYGIELDSVKTPDHPMVVNIKKILNVDMTFSMAISIFFPTIAKFLKLESFDQNAVNYFDDLTFKIIEQRLAKEGKQNPDLLGLMIDQAKTEQQKVKNGHQNGVSNGNSTTQKLKGISREEISGQGIIFFLAGYDTTQATFDHVTYYLSQYPEWQEKLYEELCEVKDDLDYKKLKELPILNAIINETLRLKPPLAEIQRESNQDCELLDTGIRIPKNTSVRIQSYMIHRDPEFYPDPDSFKPERFMDKSANLESHFSFMPFGVGPRLCIGMRFAQNELRIGLAKFFLNYKVTIDPNFELEYFHGLFLLSAKRLLVRISERT